MDIYLRCDLVNLKREYQEVCQIVIFIVKTQCREPEVLQLVCPLSSNMDKTWPCQRMPVSRW